MARSKGTPGAGAEQARVNSSPVGIGRADADAVRGSRWTSRREPPPSCENSPC